MILYLGTMAKNSPRKIGTTMITNILMAVLTALLHSRELGGMLVATIPILMDCICTDLFRPLQMGYTGLILKDITIPSQEQR